MHLMESIVVVKCMTIVMRQHTVHRSWNILSHICGNVTEGNLCVVKKFVKILNIKIKKKKNSFSAYDHGEYGGPNSCAARKFNKGKIIDCNFYIQTFIGLCECDLILANCLRRYYCPHKRNVCVSNPLRLIQNLAMVF